MGVVLRDGARIRSGEQVVADLLEDLLDLAPGRGQPAVGQLVQVDGQVRPGQEGPGRVRGPRAWRSAVPVSTTYVARSAGLAPARLSSGPARADLDVVGMRADGQHGQRPPWRARAAREHSESRQTGRAQAAARSRRADRALPDSGRAADRSGSQIIHGQLPRWYISSSCARSLTVSAGDQ